MEEQGKAAVLFIGFKRTLSYAVYGRLSGGRHTGLKVSAVAEAWYNEANL